MSRYRKLTGTKKKSNLLSAIISFNFILLRFSICIMRCYDYYCYYHNYYRYYYYHYQYYYYYYYYYLLLLTITLTTTTLLLQLLLLPSFIFVHSDAPVCLSVCLLSRWMLYVRKEIVNFRSSRRTSRRASPFLKGKSISFSAFNYVLYIL